MNRSIENSLPISLHRVPEALVDFDERSWGVDGLDNPPGSVESYEASFASFLRTLEVGTFTELLRDRKKSELSTHALDLFGGGYFLRETSFVDSITAVRLENIDDKLEKEIIDGFEPAGRMMRTMYQDDFDVLQNLKNFPMREVVEGNLYRYKTWSDLRVSMDRREIPQFDLIVCRPVGPFEPKDFVPGVSVDGNKTLRLLYLRLLGQAYNLLSKDFGILMSEVPSDVYNSDQLNYLEKYLVKSGVEIDVMQNGITCDVSTLMITKSLKSPDSFREMQYELSRYE